MIEIASQERIEAFPAEFRVEVIQEQPALFVGNLAEHVVRIAVAQIDGENLVRRLQFCKIGSQRFQAEHGLHGRTLLPIHRGHDAAFHIVGEAFVEPQIAPRGIADQVSRPRMRQFMRDHGHQTLIAHHDRGRDEGQPRILHAAFRKARRHHQHIVARPTIGPEHLLVGLYHRFGIREFFGGFLVYAEKSLIKEAAKEFADTESMIQANEKMFGPYRWSRYDILVMPPSFPEGGMENPRLSFITPTIIVGDKSLVSVIAHELGHSWAGNLVGNATWRDLWLNEGFTDYMESRIMTAVYGEQRSSMEAVLGLKSLRSDLARLKPADQILAIDLRDRDPDEVFSEIPYEKGRLFLNYLDAKFGREHFDAFLRGYFEHFAFKSITTEQFLAYLQENLLDRFPGIVSRDQVNAWVLRPGLPADAVLPVTTMFEPVDEARAAWLAGK